MTTLEKFGQSLGIKPGHTHSTSFQDCLKYKFIQLCKKDNKADTVVRIHATKSKKVIEVVCEDVLGVRYSLWVNQRGESIG